MADNVVDLGKVWVPSNDVNVFMEATVLAINGDGLMSVRTSKGDLVTVSEDDVVYVDERAVPSKTSDLICLDPPHLSNILHVLRMRSTQEECPYTFIGPVLVSVNRESSTLNVIAICIPRPRHTLQSQLISVILHNYSRNAH
jgi:hypothetical protein